MNRKAVLFALSLTLAGPAAIFAADEVADVAKDAVDPYDAGAERTRFLAAAGVDSELSEDEFKNNLAASDPFVRKFDTWASLKAFDKNGNSTVDWFEADGYRKALREAVLGTFDKSKDGKLDGEERTAANTALASGKAPRVSPPRTERPARGENTPGATPGGNNNNQPGNRGQGNNNRGGRTEEQRAAELKQFDADGDGQLNDEERGKARTARIEQWRKDNPEEAKRFDERQAEDTKRREEFNKKYDKDGNGELSDEERREGFRAEGEARLEQWRKDNPEAAARFDKQREEFLKKNDKDGDGKLSDEERNAGFAAAREEGRKKLEELTKKYDKDGDGRLNREEREAIPESEREGLFGGFGPGGGRGGQGGPGGGNRGNGGNNPAPPRANGDL